MPGFASESTIGEFQSPIYDGKQVITLDVGGHQYMSTIETLVKTEYFAFLRTNAQPEGSYFIDANPFHFNHILQYLRRGVLPVFYDQLTGHDHAKYVALLAEAKYFQVDRVVKWLEDKEYLGTVTVEHHMEEVKDTSELKALALPDTEIHLHPIMTKKKIYICPRGQIQHYGKRELCGRACKQVKGDKMDLFDETEEMHVIVHTKKTTFNAATCLS